MGISPVGHVVAKDRWNSNEQLANTESFPSVCGLRATPSGAIFVVMKIGGWVSLWWDVWSQGPIRESQTDHLSLEKKKQKKIQKLHRSKGKKEERK